MDFENAVQTAKDIAAHIDQPAWVCQEPQEWTRRRYFFVRCMTWQEFDVNYNSGNCVAVVLPDGNVFEQPNWRTR
jgi:hypothetical protein